ncbi:MAG: SIR2 family protein [Halanaerobiales bacterium]|nr:SIR2 family protein [Halanaerobiales bacterium]
MEKDTALLIGAGFSYPAKIPIMKELARYFPQTLQQEEKRIYDQIKYLVPDIQEDFELLMEISYDLSKIPISLTTHLAKEGFVSHFIDLEGLTKGSKILIKSLKKFLHDKCQVKKENLVYLYPFFNWLKKSQYALDIFSLNYDLVIENLCEEFFVPYTDGFLMNWNPGLFFNSQFQVKLYKLHGSFDWYQSELGERIKIPILKEGGKLEFLNQTNVYSMMVYPRRKKRESFGELFRFFYDRLLTLEKLVVIGYSFRDEELKKIIDESLIKNHRLHLELVSPISKQLATLFPFSERIHCHEGGVEEWIQAMWSV